MSEGEHPWQVVNRKLAEIKIGQATDRLVDSFRKRLGDAARAAAEEGQGHISPDIVSSLIRSVDPLLKIAYRIYKKVWNLQGNKVSPEFVRALYKLMIEPRIDYHLGWVRSTLGKSVDPMYPDGELSQSLLEDTEIEANKCKQKWERSCEIEALELEYLLSLPAKTGPSVVATPVVNQVQDRSGAGNEQPPLTERSAFDPLKPGSKETAIAVSYFKDGQHDMRKLSRMLADKAHIRYRRGQYHDPKSWFQGDPPGFTNHIYKLREKASDKGWADAISTDYWRSYGA